MVANQSKSARVVANMALNRHERTGTYAGPILEELLVQTRYRQRATDLVFGTLRNRAAIDMIITKFTGNPVERISAKLVNIIRLAAYELIYTPQTPQYAIVNEAVENTKTIAGKKPIAFVNAVLRQITRQIENRDIPLDKCQPQRTLPQNLLTGCEFKTDILPNPQRSPADYYSTAFSLPNWLVNVWLAVFGGQLTRQICLASNRKPSVYVRPNRPRITAEELAAKFQDAEAVFEITPDSSMIKIKGLVTEMPGFAEGLFSVQDPAASKAVKALNPEPGWKILDLCAAPGSKTTQLAELTDDKAEIVATDIDSRRLKKVKENAARLKLKSINIIDYEDIEKTFSQKNRFDCVLLDVPCSNTGVLAKRVEVRYRIKQKTISTLAEAQINLLEKAVTLIKPKGKICYSTCSISPEENSNLIKKFLAQHPHITIEHENLTFPSAEDFDHDGAYHAILSKTV